MCRSVHPFFLIQNQPDWPEWVVRSWKFYNGSTPPFEAVKFAANYSSRGDQPKVGRIHAAMDLRQYDDMSDPDTATHWDGTMAAHDARGYTGHQAVPLPDVFP